MKLAVFLEAVWAPLENNTSWSLYPAYLMPLAAKFKSPNLFCKLKLLQTSNSTIVLVPSGFSGLIKAAS